ncbi:MAG: DUF2207 domain-containing protein [Methanosphaera sp.]|nr:DUF2207 domain-containing protein [Methanosphaera sp.]
MNYKKTLPILFIILLTIPFSFASDGDYSIPEATEYIQIEDDGSCIIDEDIVYDIEGSVNGVYRDIPISGKQSITNVSVNTPGFYNRYEIINNSDSIRLKVWLYTDSQKTQRINNQKVLINFKYTFNKGVKVYNDIAEFQYMSWGDSWDSKVGTLKTFITIPGSSSDTEYWNNPPIYVTSSKWNGNVLETVAEDIPSHKTFEQRILMPKSYIKSTENANVINIDAKSQIEQDQKKYAEDLDFQGSLTSILSDIMGLLMIVPAIIYVIFGREPKIDYNAEYEHELPTNSKPIEVNDIVVGDVGEVDSNGFYAVLLDLINKGYFKILSSNSDTTIIKPTDKLINDLEGYEIDVIQYLSKFKDGNGAISLGDISNREKPEEYKSFMLNWNMKAAKFVPDSLIKRYFDDKGSRIFKIFTILLFILSIIMIILVMMDFIVINEITLLLLAIVMLIESTLLLSVPNTTPGRWTPEGKEYHDRWSNFKKYISDYSMIEERPPASVQVWGEYLVYAAALGCAKEATKTMKKYFEVGGVSSDYIADNNVIFFAYYGGFTHMDSSFSSLNASSSDSGIGSVGGGGFGGGGGGTF